MLWARNFDPQPYLGVGIAAQVAPRFQFDAFVDIGLTQDATRATLGMGMTVLVGEETAPAPAATQPNRSNNVRNNAPMNFGLEETPPAQ